MLEKLKKINLELIDNEELSQENLEKQLLIRKILSDKDCFFKISIETAYSILRDLGIRKDKLKEVYSELIDYTNKE